MEKEEISKAKRVKTLLKMQKGLIKSYQKTTEFDEPILILMKRNNVAEWHTKATKGKFKFQHSDGEERYILLNPRFIQTFDYGARKFKGYVCHEDHPTPLPSDPEITIQMMNIEIDKALNDMKLWKAKEWEAKGTFWWKVGGGVALCILAYALYVMLRPQEAGTTIIQAGEQVARNITVIP